MEENFYYHYCYSCDSERVFSNLLKNGTEAKEHCTVCGINKWFNDSILKERYYQKIMVRGV